MFTLKVVCNLIPLSVTSKVSGYYTAAHGTGSCSKLPGTAFVRAPERMDQRPA